MLTTTGALAVRVRVVDSNNGTNSNRNELASVRRLCSYDLDLHRQQCVESSDRIRRNANDDDNDDESDDEPESHYVCDAAAADGAAWLRQSRRSVHATVWLCGFGYRLVRRHTEYYSRFVLFCFVLLFCFVFCFVKKNILFRLCFTWLF